MKCISYDDLKLSVKGEFQDFVDGFRTIRFTWGLVVAIICVLLVIVGNIILLIGINFWLSIFPSESMMHNSSQIAIQVVASMLLTLFFTLVMVIFAAVYGVTSIWRTLVDTNRLRSPWYRLLLLFASGATNGLCGVLGVYAMSHTPQFIQAVLLCCIPFSAQAWTVLFIPEERKRNYLSVFFVASFVFFVAGVLLSSMSAFLEKNGSGSSASWAWALIYLASSVIFGLWCVVQRLYLDAVLLKDAGKEGGPSKSKKNEDGKGQVLSQRPEEAEKEKSGGGGDVTRGEAKACENESYAAAFSVDGGDNNADTLLIQQLQREEEEKRAEEIEIAAISRVPFSADDEEEEREDLNGGGHRSDVSASRLLLAEQRKWGKEDVTSNAAKIVLLVGGLFFQLLVSVVLFPVDAIPWFGTSSSVQEAWDGFATSIDFIFASWNNMRYGMLYSLGFAMSFIGCTFLNEHSPTLASVVLQLAGPLTSLIILIVPQWNVYKDNGNVGHKVGGVILLLTAALLYHVWEQRSLKKLVQRSQERRERQEALERLQREEEAEHVSAHSNTDTCEEPAFEKHTDTAVHVPRE